MKKIIIDCLFIVLIITPVQSFTASQPEINTFIKNYYPRNYKGHPQVWDFAQSQTGNMYFANSGVGVLEFNGTTWRKIKLPGAGVCRSLDSDKNGKIYVGAYGEFGFLETKHGITRYVSLIQKVPPKERLFHEVWQTFATPDGIYFRTRRVIFRYYNGQIELIKSKTDFYNAGYVNGRIYVYLSGVGMVQIKKNVLTDIPQGNRFYKEKISAYGILPYDHGKILFISRGKGCFIYDGKTIKPFVTEVDAEINSKRIYNAKVMKNGHFVVCTKDGGMVVIDKQGKLVWRINKSNGLVDDTVYTVFEDSQGGMWTGTSNGISRIDFNSPIRIYDESIGFKGYIESINLYKGRLIISTALGVFIQNPGNKFSFSRVPEITTSTRNIVISGEHILIASNAGYYTIIDNKVTFYNIQADVFHLSESKKHPGYIYAGTNRGLFILKKSQDGVKSVHVYKQKKGKIKSLEETERGLIYFNGEPGALHVLDLSRNILRPIFEKKYTVSDGIPDTNVNVHYLGRQLYLSSNFGMYECLQNKKVFVKSDVFGSYFSNNPVENLFIGQNGEIWIITGIFEGIYQAIKQKNGRFKVRQIHVLNLSIKGIDNVFQSPDGTAWFGGPRNLTRYFPHLRHLNSVIHPVHIAAIHSGNVSLYGVRGEYMENWDKKFAENSELKIPHEYNSLTFTLALPSYGFENAIAYRYKLEGYSEQWSEWTNSRIAGFSNLSKGRYILLVQGRDVYGNVSGITSFPFKVLSPWYATGYAFIVYVIVFASIIFGISTLHSWKLKIRADKIEAERKQLEIKVVERTLELQKTSLELSEAYKTIKEDLTMARRIQTNLLSKDYHTFTGLQFYVFFEPMIEVGGDIFDIFCLKENYYRVFIADATGHGIQAALTTTIVKTEYDKIKIFPGTPDKILNYLNTLFIKAYYNLTVFFTCAVIDFDLSQNKIFISSAGHPDVVLLSEGKISKLNVKGKMIGITDDVVYSQISHKIQKNDKILFYTDGLFEEFNENGDELGESGLMELIEKSKEKEIGNMCLELTDALKSWLGEMPVNDDITLIGIQVK